MKFCPECGHTVDRSGYHQRYECLRPGCGWTHDFDKRDVEDAISLLIGVINGSITAQMLEGETRIEALTAAGQALMKLQEKWDSEWR